MKKTLIIAGAGPSGLTSAINLVKAGYNVEIYEKNCNTGGRFRNSFQILENYTEQEDLFHSLYNMNIRVNFFMQPLTKIEFYDSRLNRYVMKSLKPFGYLIKRGNDDDSIDSGLAKQAVKAGVQIHYGKKLPLRETNIAATGGRNVAGVSKEIVFNTSINNTYKVILDNKVAPKGFSYLFVINNKATIGTAILKKFSRIDEYSRRAVERFQRIVPFNMTNISEKVNYVDFFIPKTAVDNNTLFTGEAGGFQDYLFGIGIRRSMWTGCLAAKSIIENTDFDSLWKPLLEEKMKTSIVNRFLFEKCGNIGYALMCRTMQKKDFKEFGFSLCQPGKLKNYIYSFVTRIWKNNSSLDHRERIQWRRKNNG